MRSLIINFLFTIGLFICPEVWVEFIYRAEIPLFSMRLPQRLSDLRMEGRVIVVTDSLSANRINDSIRVLLNEARMDIHAHESFKVDDDFAVLIHQDTIVDTLEFCIQTQVPFAWNGRLCKNDTLYFYVMDEIGKRDSKWESYMRSMYGNDVFPFRTAEGKQITPSYLPDWNSFVDYYLNNNMIPK